MGLIRDLIDFVLHIDQHLDVIIQTYGTWTCALMFIIVFCETGLVVTPFLPGDSLLFALGTFAARGSLDVSLVLALLSVAAVLGDTVNYWIGAIVGPKVFHKENVRFLNKRHLQRTHEFYERHGGKTIIFARFIPIIRTFAPFVAGIGAMTYSKFILFNVIGGLLWVFLFTLLGYFFGQQPFVQANFEWVVIAIIAISLVPMIWEYAASKMRSRKAAAGVADS